MPTDDEWPTSDDEGLVVRDGRVDDPEVWQDYHSEFLVAAWHRLKDHIASMGVYVLDTATFSDFTQFCFEHSSGRPPPC